MKYPVYQTEFIIKPTKGIALRTTYWSDGSITEEEVYRYEPVLFVRIDI